MKAWKLIAALSLANLVVGGVVVAIGLAYDFLGRSPGTIAMVGVALMSGPWLALSKHMHHTLEVSRKQSLVALSEHPKDVVRDLSATAAHRTIQAIVEHHGGGMLNDGEDA